MRSFIFFLLAIAPIHLCALPVGNPWEASLLTDGVFWEGCCYDCCSPCTSWWETWNVRLGYYGDFVSNRRLEGKDNEGTIRQTEIRTDAALLALNFCDRIDVFGTLGASRLTFAISEFVFSTTDGELIEMATETDFSWSIGARGTLWECGCFALGVEGAYFQSQPEINYIQEVDSNPIYLDGESLKYREWQVGLGAAYRIDVGCSAFIPYTALQWSKATVDIADLIAGGSFALFDLESQRTTGYAVGLTFLGYNKLSVTLERRFIAERAFHINVQARF